MKPRSFDYVAAATLDHAIAALAESGGNAKILAGGQSLVPMMNFRLVAPPALVDINGIQTGVGFHQYGGMDLVTTNDPSVTGDDAVLMNDYLATPSLTLESCMYLNGLQNGTYELTVYAWMPNSPGTDQQVRYDFHPGATLVGGAWPGSHVEGVTYARNVFDVTNGNIGLHVGIPSGGTTFPGAAFNGWQVRKLEPATVPTLSTWSLGALVSAVALAGAVLLRRRS